MTSTGIWNGPFGYAGGFGYQEDATGLKLLGHRYYDSSTGRFLTRDPIKDGRNWFVYCESDPLLGIDFTGLNPIFQILFKGRKGPVVYHVVDKPIEYAEKLRPGGESVYHGPKNGRPGHYHSVPEGTNGSGAPYEDDATTGIHITTPDEADNAAKAGGPNSEWDNWIMKGDFIGVVAVLALFVLAGPLEKGAILGQGAIETVDPWAQGLKSDRGRQGEWWMSEETTGYPKMYG